ncbi:MAG: hypothetical protein PHS38_13230 [Bacteroidales bacterium]|jgi:hypothetical protein|nr:hypothetical protein [Bacteroidales bacterium]
MNEEQTNLVGLLKKAINKVYEEDRFLFDFSQGERTGLEQAFVFRVGLHLNSLLKQTPYKELDLDSEYNKCHGNIKRSRRFPKGLRPDLIIHRRDSNEDNKLVVEFKGWWNNNLQSDIRKLEDLTDPNDNYHYLIGVLVKIGMAEATYLYFINGKEHE